MKKNILTIIILAMSIINVIMSAIIVFVILPTSQKTNNLVTKVTQAIDLELESRTDMEIGVSDIETYDFANKLTLNLKKTDQKSHFAAFNLSLSINKKDDDYEELVEYIEKRENAITEILADEFAKYTIDEVYNNKSKIKEDALKRIQEEVFQSDFIINISFGNLVTQ